MNLTDIDFCKPDKIEEHLSISFDFKQVNLDSYYENFRKQFYELPSDVQPLLRKEFVPKANDSSFLSAFRHPEYTVGIDLPILLKQKDTTKSKCILIIGEDPLRPHRDNETEEIILSTPYAPQYKDYRERHGKLYWQFSLYLLENYAVYYTDTTKIWICQKGKRKLKIPDDITQKFKEILKKELSEYNPKYVITFGKPAENMAKVNIPENILISFPHPSSLPFARKRWKEKYSILNTSDEEILKIMKGEFEKKTNE